MVSANTEDAVELLPPEPIVQVVRASRRPIEAFQTIAAVNQNVSTQDAELLVQFMGVTDNNNSQFISLLSPGSS